MPDGIETERIDGPCQVAVVAIGRNEGERLRACLRSVRRSTDRIVYADSGSTDGSVALAEAEGALVCALSDDRPFSAARGRNEGFALAKRRWPDTDYVQFVDGDCLLDDRWLDTGSAFLDREPKVAMLCGDNEEEFPEASVYNALCAIEWSGSEGEITACGGNAMVRASAFAEADGYDALVAAGEEPELCLRLRRAGWTIHRLAAPMTLHDADMHSFGDWWRRAERSGKAYWVGYAMHGRGPERYNAKRTARSVAWGGVLPLLALVAAFAWWPAAAAILALYTVKFVRIGVRHRGQVERPFRYAGFSILANIAEFFGVVRTILAGVPHRQPAQPEAEAIR